MSEPFRAFGILVLLAAWPAAANAAESSAGFEFCARPVLPVCIESDDIYGDAARIKACQQEVSRYTANVQAYRDCLLRETEKTLLETNAMIERFKCGIQSKRRCPPKPQAQTNLLDAAGARKSSEDALRRSK